MLPSDLRFTLRALRRNPGFAAAAIFTLALGIGAATTIFSAADTLLFHVFSYRDAGRLVVFRVHECKRQAIHTVGGNGGLPEIGRAHV